MGSGSLAILACFVAIHIFAPSLRFLQGVPRSVWLSASGGVSVAYVFVHLLPKLGAGQAPISAAVGEPWQFLEHHACLIALIGLAAFYGLDRLALDSRRRSRTRNGEDRISPAVFWIHVGSFTVYNALVGYLLVQGEDSRNPRALAAFGLAMSLHFLVVDHGLLEYHRAAYRRLGRWILCLAAAVGWAAGSATAVPEAAVAALFAFLAGGIVLNVLKEELPEERRGRYGAFAAGAAGCAALLIAGA